MTRKIHQTLLLLLSCPLFFWACEPEKTEETLSVELTSAQELKVDMDGGEFQVDYRLEGGSDHSRVTATVSASWLQVTRQEAGHVFGVVDKNTTGKDRMGAVVLSCGTTKASVVVAQSGSPKQPQLTVTTPKTLNLDRNPQTVKVEYTLINENGLDYLYARTDADWVYGFDVDVAGVVVMSIASNITGVSRSAEVTIGYGPASDVVMLTQQGDGEIRMQAQKLHGYYYGEQYSPGNGNYWFILSDRGFTPEGHSYPMATYYRIDAYGPVPDHVPSRVPIPEGHYTFDAENSMDSWTFTAEFSGYWVTDADNKRGEIQQIDAGELRVEEDRITLTLTIGSEEHTVTYEGRPDLEDASDQVNVYSTLEDDYQADLSHHHMIYECYGDYYDYGYTNWMFIIQPDDQQGDCFQFDIITSYTDEASGFLGDYVSSDYLAVNSFIPGWTDGHRMLCSWFFTYDQSELAPFRDGKMSVKDNGDGTITVDIDVYDDRRNRITGTWTGVPAPHQ